MTDEVQIGFSVRAFNATIRNRRHELHLTQRQLAAKAGVTLSIVTTLESMRQPKLGERQLRVLHVLKLDRDASPEWLAALELYGTRIVERSVSAELVAAPERLALPMWSETTIEENADPETIVLDQVTNEEHEREYRKALEKLPRRTRWVLEKHHEGEWTLEQIGWQLDLTRERVRQLIVEGENQLCRLLGQDPINSKPSDAYEPDHPR
jgi:transcriptional regulator with XRE-family HTH domain